MADVTARTRHDSLTTSRPVRRASLVAPHEGDVLRGALAAPAVEEALRELASSDVEFASSSIVDPVGKVFFHGGRVFRAIYDEGAAAFHVRLLNEPWIGDAFDAGLVRTWVPDDVSMEGARLVLEHERLSFTVFPAEFTSQMLWDAAKTIVAVGAVLARHGVYLKDAHPWNLGFARGRARFIDFGSLQPNDVSRASWLDEYRRYFAAPIWLASRRMKGLAQEYRRQHLSGFGLRLFEHPLLRRPLQLALGGLRPTSAPPERFFAKLDSWLDAHRPSAVQRERWASYEQGGAGKSPDPLVPATPKQRFVLDALSSSRPASVLDCAANKGYYSEMAARLGASVVAFDYEEFCVDECVDLARRLNLDVTPAVMDFRSPTPASGLALTCPSAFERFRCDCVLALGLCHHLCIAQSVPVKLFCEICLEYSTRGVVLEYVDPSDVHVAPWKLPIPAGYAVEGFTAHLSRKYPKREIMPLPSEGGINRTMLFFHV